MKKILFVGSFVLAFVVGAVHADDKSDVQAVFDAIIAASNARDMDEEEKHYSSEVTEFGHQGGALERLNFDGAREWIKNGGKWHAEYGKTDIKIHGTASVVTGYQKGKFIAPNGFSGEVMRRFTWVFEKQQGAWKIVHRHHSRGVFIPAESEE